MTFPNFETSATTVKLEAALAKAQASFRAAAKDSRNPHFNSQYADLASVWQACKESLTAAGIAVSQWLVDGGDPRLHIVTRLACEGEWMAAHWAMPVGKQDAQGYGSAATYARRYALAAAVGVVADEDDDGTAASERPKERKAKRESTESRSEKQAATMTEEEVESWDMKVKLAASLTDVSGELNKLGPAFAALPDCPAKEDLRKRIVKLRTDAARKAAGRIATGDAPEPERAA